MFKSIKQSWDIARAQILRTEFDDSVVKLTSAGEEVNARALVTMAAAQEQLLRECGALDDLSRKIRKGVKGMLLTKAKEAYDLDMGRGYGLALLSMHYESSYLPGDDANYVFDLTSQYVALATTGSSEALVEREP